MAEDIKSALHDATPSWNGFNYQGRVGLYVSLNEIHNAIVNLGLNTVELTDYLNETSIEYEWIEDFAIKREGRYTSLHQVKHKDGKNFSDHISAIVTILNRKTCRLSETDFNKYINLEIDFSDCDTSEKKSKRKLESIRNKILEMVNAGYLNHLWQVSDNWRTVNTTIPGIPQNKLEILLEEFQTFSSQTFDDAIIYFHTSESVTPPQKSISEYSGIPEHHRATVHNLISLSSLNIILPFDNQNTYELALNDDTLNKLIRSKILSILKIINPQEQTTKNDIDLYLASLILCIDRHIALRHKKIRCDDNVGAGFKETRDSISFINFIDILNKNMRTLDSHYWECVCADIFEKAFKEKIETLKTIIELGRNVQINTSKIKRLENHRELILNKHSYLSLLASLSPHVSLQQRPEIYHIEISNQVHIKNVFFHFIEQLETITPELLITFKDDYIFHPSLIDISNSNQDEYDIILDKYRYIITENKNLGDLVGATHLVINATEHQDVSNTNVFLENIITQSLNDHNEENILNQQLKFEKISNALAIINQ